MAFVLRLSPEQEADLVAAAAATGRSAAAVVRAALDGWLHGTSGLDARSQMLFDQGDADIGPRLAAEHRIRGATEELSKAVASADEDRRYSPTGEFPAEAADEVRQLVGRLEALLSAAPEDPRTAPLALELGKVVSVFGSPPPPPAAAPMLTKAAAPRKRSAEEVRRAGVEAYLANARRLETVYRVSGDPAVADYWEGVAETLTQKLAKP